jgi:hypothetical protein
LKLAIGAALAALDKSKVIALSLIRGVFEKNSMRLGLVKISLPLIRQMLCEAVRNASTLSKPYGVQCRNLPFTICTEWRPSRQATLREVTVFRRRVVRLSVRLISL